MCVSCEMRDDGRWRVRELTHYAVQILGMRKRIKLTGFKDWGA